MRDSVMPDFDPFDEFSFDDGPGFDDGRPGRPDEAEAQRAAAPERARALVAGETGLRFESLALFAEPLFRHFDLDAAEAFALKEKPDAAEPEAVAVLEAARLLWAFFELPPPERARRRNVLAAHLLGEEPAEQDWVEVEAILDAVEPYWHALLPEERAHARQPGREPLGWDALVAHPAYRLDGEAGDAARGIGPNGLSELEARALFAQPLIEEAAASGDPDAVEAVMDRAARYWGVARTPAPERDAALAEVVAALAPAPADRAAVEAEARRMLARYRSLFDAEG